jgi:RNA-directed DNA polymerase
MSHFTPHLVDFTLPTCAEDVATTLGAPRQLFDELIDPHRKESHYIRHRIPKRRPVGAQRFRDVWECASDEVATIHKSLARRLDLFIRARSSFPHPIAHGYIATRSTLTNAAVHAGARLLLRVDIANFFPSITQERIQNDLLALDLKQDAASALGELCTLGSTLPLGLNASPLLANLTCLGLDRKLTALAQKLHANVTRYADDLAFSGSAVPSIDEVGAVLEEEGFQLARAKCRRTKRGQAHYVTGLSISDSVPRLPKTAKRRLRQELHYAENYGILSHLERIGQSNQQSGINRIDGTIRYFNAIEPRLARRMAQTWQAILKRDQLSPSYAPRSQPRAAVSIFIDEATITTCNKDFLAISMVLTTEVERVRETLESVLHAHLVDPCATGDKGTLTKTGIHWCDNSEDLKTTVFKALETLPIRGYIAYCHLAAPTEYERVYLQLVKELATHRLIFFDQAEVSFIFEQNPQVSIGNISKVVDEAFNRLVEQHNRRPKARPLVRLGTKLGDPCLATADYLLGAFRRYAVLDVPATANNKPKPPGELAQLRFERLRDKIRLILAIPSRRSFSRRDPFRPWPGGAPPTS